MTLTELKTNIDTSFKTGKTTKDILKSMLILIIEHFDEVPEMHEDLTELRQQVEQKALETKNYRDEAASFVARKIDNWQVATKADAVSLSNTLNNSAFIEVEADETQGGARILYFWNTETLQEPLLL